MVADYYHYFYEETHTSNIPNLFLNCLEKTTLSFRSVQIGQFELAVIQQ